VEVLWPNVCFYQILNYFGGAFSNGRFLEGEVILGSRRHGMTILTDAFGVWCNGTVTLSIPESKLPSN